MESRMVVENTKTGELYIVKKEWFKEMKLRDTYNEYGINNTSEEEENNIIHGYNYFNGHNFETIFLEDDLCSSGDVKRIEDVTEEQKILKEFEGAIEIQRDIYGYTKESKDYIFKMSDSNPGFWVLAIVKEKEVI
jgi:hypothetical protein